jgi:hypothetical protein
MADTAGWKVCLIVLHSTKINCMKGFGKYKLTAPLFITVFIIPGAHAQLSLTKSTAISRVLHLSIEDTFLMNKNRCLYTYFRDDSLDAFEVNYFDTVVVKTKNESDFNIALKGFTAGKFAGEMLRHYDLRLTDTSIGNLSGLFITGTTHKMQEGFKKFYCYLTIANNNSYWFFYYQKTATAQSKRGKRFFSSIQFDRSKITEAACRVKPFKKHKEVGEVWYLSPELDFEVLMRTKKKTRNSNLLPMPVIPPKPKSN